MPSNKESRCPRTLQEAFGPHTSTFIQPPKRSRAGEWLYWMVCAASLAVVLLDVLVWRK